ncbi:MAG: glycosyltransferase [Gaiellaceae bacterium]
MTPLPARSARVVIVSPFSPLHDGTAKYADQLVESLEAEGRRVLPIGLPGSGTAITRRLSGGLRPLRLLTLTHRGDEVWLLWHPGYFISGRAWSRIAAYLSLSVVLRLRDGGVNVQFPDARYVRGTGPVRRMTRRLEELARRFFWRSAARLQLHTRWEGNELFRRFGQLKAQVSFVANGARYRPYVELGREEARASLGLDAGTTIFLCIGFIGETKGFDRALEAFATVGADRTELHIVGSIPYGTEREHRYLAALGRRVDEVPGAHLEVGWIDDEEFDLWLQAADAVLAPYRSAASSGVVGRAKLHDRAVIASRVGGVPEQLGSEDVVVDSDAELAAAVARFAARASAHSRS